MIERPVEGELGWEQSRRVATVAHSAFAYEANGDDAAASLDEALERMVRALEIDPE